MFTTLDLGGIREAEMRVNINGVVISVRRRFVPFGVVISVKVSPRRGILQANRWCIANLSDQVGDV
jgi:hypothetical protein